jgi:hypothetical protein
MFNLEDELLTEVTHAPLGVLAGFMGWERWTELRLPAADAVAAGIWRGLHRHRAAAPRLSGGLM